MLPYNITIQAIKNNHLLWNVVEDEFKHYAEEKGLKQYKVNDMPPLPDADAHEMPQACELPEDIFELFDDRNEDKSIATGDVLNSQGSNADRSIASGDVLNYQGI